MDVIIDLYTNLNGALGCFTNKNYFYTLYCVLVNQMFGITNENLSQTLLFNCTNIQTNINILSKKVTEFISDYENNINDKDNINGLYIEFSDFAKNHKSRTTSKAERLKRITFLNNYIGSEIDNDND